MDSLVDVRTKVALHGRVVEQLFHRPERLFFRRLRKRHLKADQESQSVHRRVAASGRTLSMDAFTEKRMNLRLKLKPLEDRRALQRNNLRRDHSPEPACHQPREKKRKIFRRLYQTQRVG